MLFHQKQSRQSKLIDGKTIFHKRFVAIQYYSIIQTFPLKGSNITTTIRLYVRRCTFCDARYGTQWYCNNAQNGLKRKLYYCIFTIVTMYNLKSIKDYINEKIIQVLKEKLNKLIKDKNQINSLHLNYPNLQNQNHQVNQLFPAVLQ